MKRRAFFRVIAGAAAMASLPALAHVDPADVEREREAMLGAMARLWNARSESPVIYMHPDDYFAIVADVEGCTIAEARERFPLNPAPWEDG